MCRLLEINDFVSPACVHLNISAENENGCKIVVGDDFCIVVRGRLRKLNAVKMSRM